MSLLCYILSLTVCLGNVDGYRILIMPLQTKSRISGLGSLGEELAFRGHNVYFLVRKHLIMSVPQWIESHPNITLIQYGVAEDEKDSNADTIRVLFQRQGARVDYFSKTAAYFQEECETLLLNNRKLLERLVKLHLDVAIVESVPIYKCPFLIPYTLNISFIYYSSFLDPWIARLPWLPSLAPTAISQLLFQPQTMDLLKRVLNTLATAATTILLTLLMEPRIPEITRRYNFRGSLDDLPPQSILWLHDNDPLLTWNYPTMPHVVDVGGLGIHLAQPLPNALEALIYSSDEGTVLVSFGTAVTYLPPEVIRNMLFAFQRFPRHIFLWSLPKELVPVTDVPDNVHMRHWLPQSDVLAHSKLVLFVSHCGIRGTYEAMFNGVPMVCLPVLGDQNQNARNVAMKGYGQILNIFSFTTEELHRTIHHVLNTPSFRIQTQRASEMFRDRPETPRQVGARWVEHVLKYGGAHLKSHAFELPWWSFWLLDVMAFLVFCLTVIFVLGWLICRRLYVYSFRVCGRKIKPD